MNRTIFLPSEGLRWMVVHGDHFARRHNLNLQPGAVVLGKLGFDGLRLSNQNHTHSQLACSQHTSFNLGTGRVVPSHRIYGNCDHWELLPSATLPNLLSGDLFDRLALVVAAAGACLMRLLHLMAMRAFCKRRLSQVIVSPAGAGAAFGMASLWIWHSTTP